MKKIESVCEEVVFNRIYTAQIKALYNFMYYKCGDVAKSEDFVQESFIRLWNNCAKVAIEKSKSFLFTVANNLFLSAVQHQKVVLKHQKQSGVLDSTNENPEFLLEEKEFLNKLQSAITNLPDNQRVVFLMSRIDKKKYREIAELLDVSIKTVEKRMSLALRYLEEKLGTEYKV